MISIDYSMIIVILNFILLLVVLNKLLFKPLKQYLIERQKSVQQEIDQAKDKHKSADELLKQRDAELKKSSEDIRQLTHKAKKEAVLKAEDLLEETKKRQKHIMQETDEQLIHKQKVAHDQIEQNIAVLVSDLTAKLLNKKVDNKQDKELIESIIKEGK
ncbi:MAG: ATP synthase F0 subunit B [Candidatus Stygibacter frigidus]|nr:ATP synthase F0 subunit B [Candidatus Stygibacter frigidus]